MDINLYIYGGIVMILSGLVALTWLATRARFTWDDVRRYRARFAIVAVLAFLGAGLMARTGPRGPWPASLAVGIAALGMFLWSGRGSAR